MIFLKRQRKLNTLFCIYRSAYRGNGRGRGRGGQYNGGNREFRGKREFERRSGSDKSGVRSSEKREGAGAHNWGSELDAATAEVTEAMNETSVTDATTDPAVVKP